MIYCSKWSNSVCVCVLLSWGSHVYSCCWELRPIRAAAALRTSTLGGRRAMTSRQRASICHVSKQRAERQQITTINIWHLSRLHGEIAPGLPVKQPGRLSGCCAEIRVRTEIRVHFAGASTAIAEMTELRLCRWLHSVNSSFSLYTGLCKEWFIIVCKKSFEYFFTYSKKNALILKKIKVIKNVRNVRVNMSWGGLYILYINNCLMCTYVLNWSITACSLQALFQLKHTRNFSNRN